MSAVTKRKSKPKVKKISYASNRKVKKATKEVLKKYSRAIKALARR